MEERRAGAAAGAMTRSGSRMMSSLSARAGRLFAQVFQPSRGGSASCRHPCQASASRASASRASASRASATRASATGARIRPAAPPARRSRGPRRHRRVPDRRVCAAQGGPASECACRPHPPDPPPHGNYPARPRCGIRLPHPPPGRRNAAHRRRAAGGIARRRRPAPNAR